MSTEKKLRSAAGGAAGAAGGSAGKSGVAAGASGTRAGRVGGPVGEILEPVIENKSVGFVDERTKTPKNNCLRSRERENDWTIIHAIVNGIVKEDFPEEVDLRTGNDWWEIANQGDTSSCTSWAATDSLLRWHLIRAKKIQSTEKLSVRFTWMAAKETDKFTEYPETFIEPSGTSLKSVLNILKKYGAVLEKHLPFEGAVGTQMDVESFYSMASLFSINSYYSIIKENDVNLDHIRMWINSVGPVMVMTDTDSNFKNYNNGGKLDQYDLESALSDSMGHAFAIVGYTKDHFIIRNSWGTKWGDQGYAYASNEYVAAAFYEGYGIWI